MDILRLKAVTAIAIVDGMNELIDANHSSNYARERGGEHREGR